MSQFSILTQLGGQILAIYRQTQRDVFAILERVRRVVRKCKTSSVPILAQPFHHFLLQKPSSIVCQFSIDKGCFVAYRLYLLGFWPLEHQENGGSLLYLSNWHLICVVSVAWLVGGTATFLLPCHTFPCRTHCTNKTHLVALSMLMSSANYGYCSFNRLRRWFICINPFGGWL